MKMSVKLAKQFRLLSVCCFSSRGLESRGEHAVTIICAVHAKFKSRDTEDSPPKIIKENMLTSQQDRQHDSGPRPQRYIVVKNRSPSPF